MSAHWSTAVEIAPEYTLDPLLSTLRLIARQQRLKPMDPDAPGHPLARLMARLSQCLGRTLVFHPCGAVERSFDESWLLALFHARMRCDGDSYRFLLNSRLSREQASEVHFLIAHAHLTLDMFA